MTWERYKNFIVDMDGVIYRGKHPLPGSDDFFRFLRERKSKIAFFSNNSTITKGQYVDKLKKMNIYASEDEIISSSSITAYYVARENPQSQVYCIGEAGIRDELQKNGIKMIDDSSNENIHFVIVGMDRQFNYEKLTKAMRYVLNGAQLYGTNPDLTYPMEDGLIPGCGAILASIEACTGTKAKVFGKPQPESIQFLLEMTGFSVEDTILIGDRLDTDIVLAKQQNIFSILVLTGVHQGEDVKKTGIVPDMIVENLIELKKIMLMKGEA
ncbi:HAD-IIA family hydrolase [Atribacter laminatus]|uniref:HAD-IIA family hydrolase n=1 Tax=Atribacter laminatus TaxID=2847778 RepID=UPI001C402C41|nr:HAD-IIA family hydrolase [Atribacter laminatus]